MVGVAGERKPRQGGGAPLGLGDPSGVAHLVLRHRLRPALHPGQDRLGHARWQLAYQSRSGRPQDPWLEPDVNLVVEQLAAAGERRVVVAPIGFVCDHVEVLYDLDDEAQATAARCGIAMTRAGTVCDHPEFIAMLAKLVQEAWSR